MKKFAFDIKGEIYVWFVLQGLERKFSGGHQNMLRLQSRKHVQIGKCLRMRRVSILPTIKHRSHIIAEQCPMSMTLGLTM